MKLEEGDDLGRSFGERYILTATTQGKTAKAKKRESPVKGGASYDIARGMTVRGNTNPPRYIGKKQISRVFPFFSLSPSPCPNFFLFFSSFFWEGGGVGIMCLHMEWFLFTPASY